MIAKLSARYQISVVIISQFFLKAMAKLHFYATI